MSLLEGQGDVQRSRSQGWPGEVRVAKLKMSSSALLILTGLRFEPKDKD